MRRFVEYLKSFRLSRPQLMLAALAFTVSLALVGTPVRAASFSLSMTDMMNTAADIFNGLWPAFAIVVGLGLGVQILRFIVNAVKAAF